MQDHNEKKHQENVFLHVEIIGNRECTDKIGMKLSFMNNMLEPVLKRKKKTED